MIQNEWMTIKDACEYVNIHRHTMNTWIEQGLKCSKIGGCQRIKKSNIDAFLELYEEKDNMYEILSALGGIE